MGNIKRFNKWYSNSKPMKNHHSDLIGTTMNGGKVIGVGQAPKRNYPEGTYAHVVFPDKKAEYIKLS